MTPAPSDGILRRVTDRIWIVTLRRYQVHVVYSGDSWCFAVISPQGYTEVCPRVGSFGEGARRVREWIEQRQLKFGRARAVASPAARRRAVPPCRSCPDLCVAKFRLIILDPTLLGA
jgi:hypothetical protein